MLAMHNERLQVVFIAFSSTVNIDLMINMDDYSNFKLCPKINNKRGLFVKTLQKSQ